MFASQSFWITMALRTPVEEPSSKSDAGSLELEADATSADLEYDPEAFRIAEVEV